MRELRRALAENTRLIDALKRQVAEVTAAEIRLKSLHEIDLGTTSTLDLPAVLRLLMEKVSGFFPGSSINIWLVNPESKRLDWSAPHRLERKTENLKEPADLGPAGDKARGKLVMNRQCREGL